MRQMNTKNFKKCNVKIDQNVQLRKNELRNIRSIGLGHRHVEITLKQ